MGRSGNGKQNILWGWPYHQQKKKTPITVTSNLLLLQSFEAFCRKEHYFTKPINVDISPLICPNTFLQAVLSSPINQMPGKGLGAVHTSHFCHAIDVIDC